MSKSIDELRADLKSYQDSIPKIDANIAKYTTARNAWQAAANRCSGTRSKKAACIEGNMKRVNDYNGLISGQSTLKATRLATIKRLEKEIENYSEVSVNLSKGGETRTSVQTKANAVAEVTKQKGAVEAEAMQVKVTQQKATSKIAIALVAVVAIAVAVVIYRKFIKKKK